MCVGTGIVNSGPPFQAICNRCNRYYIKLSSFHVKLVIWIVSEMFTRQHHKNKMPRTTPAPPPIQSSSGRTIMWLEALGVPSCRRKPRRMARKSELKQTEDNIWTDYDWDSDEIRLNRCPWCITASVSPVFGELCEAHCDSSMRAVLNLKCLFSSTTHLHAHTHPLPHAQLDAARVFVCVYVARNTLT